MYGDGDKRRKRAMSLVFEQFIACFVPCSDCGFGLVDQNFYAATATAQGAADSCISLA